MDRRMTEDHHRSSHPARAVRTRIAPALTVLVLALTAAGCGRQGTSGAGASPGPQGVAVTSGGKANGQSVSSTISSDVFSYAVLNTVDYSGRGDFSSRVSGVMAIAREELASGEVSYSYDFDVDVSADRRTSGELLFPPVTIRRDPKTERFVGGNALMKPLGLISNAALDQVVEGIRPDGTAQTRRFVFRSASPRWPRTLGYKITARRQRLDVLGDVVVALSTSDPFQYQAPGAGRTVTAELRELYVLSADMDVLHFQASAFVAAANVGDAKESLRVETLMHRLEGSDPVSLAGLDEGFTREFASLCLVDEEGEVDSDTALPAWAAHSMAVRDVASLGSAAAVEGRPNFAITATVGLVLLADTGISVATTALHEAGLIDWEWEGIPSFIGGLCGQAVAGVYEDITGQDVDEEQWRDTGGLIGDIATLFLPDKALNAGLKFTLKGGKHVSVGLKILKNQNLAGKALRIGRRGIQLVRAGKGWLNSAKTYKRLKALLDLYGKGSRVVKYAQKYPPPPVSGRLAMCLVIDQSGSMKSDDKLPGVKAAAERMVLLPGRPSRCGVVGFSNDARTFQSLMDLDGGGNGPIVRAIGSLSPGGGTNVEAGLRAGLDALTGEAPDSSRVILLLSDGQQNSGSARSVIPALCAARVRVYTVAYGLDADRALLEEIARRTGGESFRAETDDVAWVLNRIRASAMGESGVLAIREIIPPGATHEFCFEIPAGASSTTVRLDWPGSHLTLRIVDPAGTVYAVGTTSEQVQFVDDPDRNLSCFKMMHPAAGTWHVGIYADNVTEEGEFYDLFAGVTDGLCAFLDLNQPRFSAGEEVTAKLSLAPGVSVTRAVLQLSGLDGAVKETVMTRPPDGSTGDANVWLAHFDAPQADGLYEARALLSFVDATGRVGTRVLRTTVFCGTETSVRERAAAIWQGVQDRSNVPTAGIVFVLVLVVLLLASLMVIFVHRRTGAASAADHAGLASRDEQ